MTAHSNLLPTGQPRNYHMEMQGIELIGALAHRFQQHHVVGNGVANMGIEAKRHVGDGHQFRARDGIAAGEQCHVMPLVDQRLGEVRNDALGPAVQLWRHAFGQGSDLSDFHSAILIIGRRGAGVVDEG